MAKFSYFPLTDDHISPSTTTVVVVTADADYPAEKLQNIPMADTARAPDPPGAIVRVRIDLGAAVGAKNLRAWFFLNHNIYSGNWIIHRTNAAWASAENQAVTFRDLDTWRFCNSWGAASRYWEVEFPAACVYKGTGAFWEMGKIIAGLDITSFSFNFKPGLDRGYAFEVIHNVTELGVEWTHLKQEGVEYIGLNWRSVIAPPATMLTEIKDFIYATSGGMYPCVILPMNARDETELYYMRNVDRVNWRESYVRALLENCRMDFKEEARGKVQLG